MLTLISSILTKSSLETGKSLLEVISASIYFVLEQLKASKDVHDTLDELLLILSPNNRSSQLSASRQAVSDNLLKDTRARLDKKLHENYGACMNALAECNARSREIVLSIDTTAEEAKARYLNDHYSYINVGQAKTWKRGFKYSAIHDATHQLFISTFHQNYHHSKQGINEIQGFIRQLQDACAVVEQAGSSVSYIDGDRAYYDAELFAAAYFGQITAFCAHPHDVKIIVPTKFTRDKTEKKIAFLENFNTKEVFKEYIPLSKYTHPSLIHLCKSARLETRDSLYLVPVVTVAVVDEYNAKSRRSLDELRQEWMTVKTNMRNSQEQLDNLQDEYMELQKEAGIAKPRKIARITQRKRTFFRTRTIAWQYKRIIATMKYIKQLKHEKSALLNSLMFFTISASSNEDIDNHVDKYKKMALVYHERWGIESGFKEEKAKFLRTSRNRKPTHRQWNMEVGMMLYNRWHVKRMKLMLDIQRKHAWNKVPWDPRHPHLRRKWERENGMILSAESFLLQLLLFGIILRLKRLFST